MLHSKALSELLSKNSDDRLCKRWFLMTPNGTLLAYTQPTNIRSLRREAAKAALVWQEHQTPQSSNAATTDGDATKPSIPSLVRTLTMETDSANLIFRKVQPQLLLVLEGGVPPRRRAFEPRVTPEGPSDAPYPSPAGQFSESGINSSASSIAESTKSSVAHSVLGMQRKKFDALASAIAQSFEQTTFKMPDEASTRMF